jgi:hypothetical protein
MSRRQLCRMPLLAAVCVGVSWIGANVSRAAEEEAIPSRSSRTQPVVRTGTDAGRSTRSSETGGAAKIEAKLDQILGNQERILARLDEVMEELKIVKIRATVR